MTFATLDNGTRGGRLVLVDRSLSRAVAGANLAPTMQMLLDHWDAVSPAMAGRDGQLNADTLPDAFEFVAETAIIVDDVPMGTGCEQAAGTIIGSGTISKRDSLSGFRCIQKRRMTEIIAIGAPVLEFLKFDDLVESSVDLSDGSSAFGPICQRVTQYQGAQWAPQYPQQEK